MSVGSNGAQVEGQYVLIAANGDVITENVCYANFKSLDTVTVIKDALAANIRDNNKDQEIAVDWV